MCAVPGPASQDAVFKRVYASPGLQCSHVAHQYVLCLSYMIMLLDFKRNSRMEFFNLYTYFHAVYVFQSIKVLRLT